MNQSETNNFSKMKKIFIFQLLAIFIFNPFSFAITAQPINELRAPEKSQWTVTVSRKEFPTAGNQKNAKSQNKADENSQLITNEILKSIVSKEKEIYRVVNYYNNQTQEEWWISHKYQFVKLLNNDKIISLLSSQNRAWNLEESDFPELYWVNGQTPQLEEVDGRNVLVIKMDASKKPLTNREARDLEEMRRSAGQSGDILPPSRQANLGTLVLSLDPKTGMPIRFEDVDRIYSYTFGSIKNLSDQMPEDFKKEIAAFEGRVAEIIRPASKPKVRNPQKQP